MKTEHLIVIGLVGAGLYFLSRNAHAQPAVSEVRIPAVKKKVAPPEILSVTRSWTERGMDAGYF